jgi:dipeptidyl aminopeptidase/acylaminoacyl peptidase
LFAAAAETGELDRLPLVSTPGYDFQGDVVQDTASRRLLGVHYETDAAGTVWFDAGMRALQAQVDRLLPATINRIDCEQCAGSPNVLVTAGSDRQPPLYLLFNRQTEKLTLVAASRPWIDPARMGTRDLLRFKARDGLEIPVLVTQPPGKAAGPRPAVVLVHGGPWVRGTHWRWAPWAQFLASRGYVVIEPEFRGSTGYGDKLFRAGWKQWGLAMQDDVTDATRWAERQGWLDPQRVCLAGASYGGYATLMGLIKEPALYACGFEWAGVSDIGLMYSLAFSDTSDEAKRYGMPVMIGDPVADAAQLTQTSPLQQADRLHQPLLIAHGGEDSRVPIRHGVALRDAVRKTNPQVEWVEYPAEGHGWRELATNIDFWGRVERFLDRQIGPNAAAR